jgi:Fic family protein
MRSAALILPSPIRAKSANGRRSIWAALTKSSQDTALRDIADLIAKGILRRDDKGGRSTSYLLVIP